MEEKNMACGCPCHKSVGVLVILIGLDILLGNLGVLEAKVVGIVWPILLMIIGLKKSIRCKCCAHG